MINRIAWTGRRYVYVEVDGNRYRLGHGLTYGS